MGRGKKCGPCPEVAEWLLTYGDMITLVLTFFILLYVTKVEGTPSAKMDVVLSSFSGLGNKSGGNTLSPGKLAELGNTVNTLPSLQSGRAVGDARRMAVSLFEPEVKNKTVTITQDERGLVISLSADAFFDVGSAEIKKEEAREVLRKVGQLVTNPALVDKKVRFEGHTDDDPTNPDGEWPTNWHLGGDRAINAMIYTAELSGSQTIESRFHATTYGQYGTPGNKPSNTTREERAGNRRVDIIILSDGNF